MVIVSLALLVAIPEPQAASVVLRWKAVDNAAKYELEIAEDAQFHAVKLSTQVEGTGYRWQELPEKTHFFRVRSVDGAGNYGPYSEMKEIAAVWVPPAFSRPKATAMPLEKNLNLTFDFIPSVLFTQYHLELAADPQFKTIVADKWFDQVPVSLPITRTGVFYYRLTAKNTAGRTAGPSAAQAITIVPATPEPRTDDGVLVPPGLPIELRWNPALGADKYRVQIAKDARFKQIEAEQKTTEKSIECRPAAGEHYWRVFAEDAGGRKSTPSLARKFNALEAPASVPASKPEEMDIDAGAIIGVFGGLQYNFATPSAHSGPFMGARIGAGPGDVLLLLSIGLGALDLTREVGRAVNVFLLSTVPFVEYDFHISWFRLRLGVGPAMNANFVRTTTSFNAFQLGVAAMLGLGFAAGGQEVSLETRYTWAPVTTENNTLRYESGGLMFALSVWYGSGQ